MVADPNRGRLARALGSFWYSGAGPTATNEPARALAVWLTTLDADLRPDEVGTPWGDLQPLNGYFTDAAHQDHLHLGHDG